MVSRVATWRLSDGWELGKPVELGYATVAPVPTVASSEPARVPPAASSAAAPVRVFVYSPDGGGPSAAAGRLLPLDFGRLETAGSFGSRMQNALDQAHRWGCTVLPTVCCNSTPLLAPTTPKQT